MECHSALKKEILNPAAMWMDLENTVLTEMSQTQKDTSRVTPLT